MGECEALTYHATYTGIADCMRAGDNPVVVWGRPQAHFCLGQHQNLRAELVAEPHVPVLRRPLGGGGVWLDTHQACVVLIAPREWFPSRTQDWYAQALSPMLRVYTEQGWPVKQVQQDIWLHHCRLAGSGAATIGKAGVVGSSFLLDFPIAEFIRLIATPSAGFAGWLHVALAENLTTWSQHGAVPEADWLSMMYRRAAVGEFSWRWEQATLREDERESCLSWHEELLSEASPDIVSKKVVPYGIKVRAACFLTERVFDEQHTVRVLTRDGAIARVALSSAPLLPELALQHCPVHLPSLVSVLSAWMSSDEALCSAQQIMNTAFFEHESR